MKATETDAFKKADAAVRKSFAPKDRWRWRLAFKTRSYAPACEVVAAVERMNYGLFPGETPPVADLVYTASPDGSALFHELIFTADDETANSARLIAMGGAVPGSGHLNRLSHAD